MQILFFYPDLMNRVFHLCLLEGSVEVKRILTQGTKWLELILLFLPLVKTILVRSWWLQMSQQDASAFIMRYWFRGEPNLQFSENMFFLYFQSQEQTVQTNKAKALGWRYRVDLTLCFFTYRIEQIVDYNCSMLARFIFQFCVFYRRNIEILFVSSLLYLQFLFYGDCGGWQRPGTESH